MGITCTQHTHDTFVPFCFTTETRVFYSARASPNDEYKSKLPFIPCRPVLRYVFSIGLVHGWVSDEKKIDVLRPFSVCTAP